MTTQEKRKDVRTQLMGLECERMTEQQLNDRLSEIFNQRIEVEQGLYDEDWQGDDYYTFCVDDEEIGGYFDIYYLKMNRQDYFYITEICIYFE